MVSWTRAAKLILSKTVSPRRRAVSYHRFRAQLTAAVMVDAIHDAMVDEFVVMLQVDGCMVF